MPLIPSTMIVLWYPQNKDKEMVSTALQQWTSDKVLFHQQVQDWINARFPSFDQCKVYLTDNYSLIDTTCSICLEPSNQTTKCGHFFHHACIAKWAQRTPTCPLCRSAL